MKRASILIGCCLLLAITLTVLAQRAHPEIMQDIAGTRQALQESIEGGDGPAAAVAAERLGDLFREAIPIYEQMNLEPAVMIATKAAAAAAEAAAAANLNNMDAAGTAHGSVQKACGGCHSQFREKAPDGSFRFKTP